MSTILHILRQVNVNDFIVKPKRSYSDPKIYTGGIDITICYDVFEKRRQVEYGNGTISNYFNEPQQVLQQMQVSTPNGTLFMSNNYEYDLNSNITQISNTASAIAINQLGGIETKTFEYDDFNRLRHSEGTWLGDSEDHVFVLDMEYNSLHNILSKSQSHQMAPSGSASFVDTPNSMNNYYSYTGGNQPHAVSSIDVFDPVTKLQRTNNIGTRVDNLTYNYTCTRTNRLNFVSDAVPAAPNHPNDIDSGQVATNYVYNVLGQLTLNKQEITHYVYNTQGLVIEIRQGSLTFASATTNVVKFFYNVMGHRIRKESTSGAITNTTYYVLDASGNAMAIYNKAGTVGTVVQTELPIYGASRVGVYMKGVTTDSKTYQLTDHLGNVRAVAQRAVGSNIVTTLSYADYYPFGEQLQGRSSASNYRYAYQGQEKDNETGMEAFELRLWDGRLGRWLTVDPKHAGFSPYWGMNNNPISIIDPDGGQGEDFYKDLITGKVSWFEGSDKIDGYKHLEFFFTEYDSYKNITAWGDGITKQSWSKSGGYVMHLDEIVLSSARYQAKYVEIGAGATVVAGFGISFAYVQDSYGKNAISFSFDVNQGLGAGVSFGGGNINKGPGNKNEYNNFRITDNEGGSVVHNVNLGPLGLYSEGFTVENGIEYQNTFSPSSAKSKFIYSGGYFGATEVKLKPKLKFSAKVEAIHGYRNTFNLITW